MKQTIKEAAKEYAKGMDLYKDEESVCISDAEAFEDGAKWMREVIIKEINERRKYISCESLNVRAAIQIMLNRLESTVRNV